VLATGSRSSEPGSGKDPDGSAAVSDRRAGDGRTARGARARRSIAEALVSLLADGVARPTARQVAERAGVSLRLVFHHFEDMESVLRSAVAVQAERHWDNLDAVSPSGALSDRVRSTVNQRARLFEAIAPVRRAAAQASGGSPTLARQLESSRKLLRARLCETFSKELSQSGDSRENVLDALEVATSFETWDQLRQISGRSVVDTCGIVGHLALGALGNSGGARIAAFGTQQDRR
jgi:TetR/AcrR family transcriptional regulator of autoinduction and epiphytic fitness